MYSTYDRELLAMYLSVLYFKPIVEGQQLVVVTDHKPLVTAFKSLVPAKSDRQLSFLTEFVTQVLYTKGSDNIVADTLSWVVALKLTQSTWQLLESINRTTRRWRVTKTGCIQSTSQMAQSGAISQLLSRDPLSQLRYASLFSTASTIYHIQE